MSFRAKTALTVAIVTAIALGGAFAVVWAAFSGLQRRQLDASLLDVARAEALEAPANGMEFDDRPGPAANDVGPLTKYGVIYDVRGRAIAATPPFDVTPPPLATLRNPIDDPFDLWFGKQHLRGVLVTVPGHPGMTLFLSTSREDLDGDEAFLFRAMLAAIVAAVAWASAVAYWMGSRLARFHQTIAQVARGVAKGDLAARVRFHPDDPEMAQLGRDVNEMIEQLGELLGSHERFIAHAAHELRSPLTALYGELQQALRKDRDAEGYKDAIQAALVATRRLKLLSEDLLTLARTRSEKRSPSSEPISLAQAMGEAFSLVDSSARERGVTVSVDAGVPCWVIDWNGDIARMLRNVLENAVRHSPRGGVVRVMHSMLDGTVRITVADQGPGVDDTERAAIFEPFFRSKRAAKSDGAGLGLSIAREIARAHDGELVLDGSPAEGKGATFVISLRSTSRAPQSASASARDH